MQVLGPPIGGVARRPNRRSADGPSQLRRPSMRAPEPRDSTAERREGPRRRPDAHTSEFDLRRSTGTRRSIPGTPRANVAASPSKTPSTGSHRRGTARSGIVATSTTGTSSSIAPAWGLFGSGIYRRTPRHRRASCPKQSRNQRISIVHLFSVHVRDVVECISEYGCNHALDERRGTWELIEHIGIEHKRKGH